MSDLFRMDGADLIRLHKFYKRAPEAFKRAAAATLNAMAFGTRKEAIGIIHSRMTVRNAKFIDGSIKVDKARANVPMNRLEAATGSVVRPRYSGLVEQETGKTPNRARTFTTASREGNVDNPTKGWARLKPNAKYPSPGKENLGGLTGSKRIVAFLHILSERKAAQTFILRKRFGRFKRGLYRFKQGVIRKLQSFDDKHKPRRIRWLTGGREQFLAANPITKLWAKSISFQLKKFK